MSAMPIPDDTISETEYLAMERESQIKHEYIDGEIVAMTGASEAHNLIVANTIANLHSQLRGRPCKTYPSDMKVRTPSTGTYVYPDVTIVCGEAQFDDEKSDILLNPTVIVEVLSPTTEPFDRGKKFQRYREIESLREYILIAQDNAYIERFSRQDDGLWQLNDAHGLDSKITLTGIGCVLSLADIYEQVNFN